MEKPKTININDTEYVRADLVPEPKKAQELDGMEYVLIRGDRSGVFTGYLEREEGQEVILRQARRIWYWSGAASISQLAQDGTSDPENCKFPKEVARIKIKDVIEIIEVTEKARLSIKSVAVWEE